MIYTPQQAIEDFKKGKFAQENRDFLEPLYDSLFHDLGSALIISDPLKNHVQKLFEFFDLIDKISVKFELQNLIESEPEKALTILKKELLEEQVSVAVSALGVVVEYIASERKNINGLEALLWTLFNETSRESLLDEYMGKPGHIQEQLLGRPFLTMLLAYPRFAHIAVQNVLMPIELINPTRRQGDFDAKVLSKIMEDLISEGLSLEYEPQKGVGSIDEEIEILKNQTNWGISEDSVKRLALPEPPHGKIPDIIVKIGDTLIIGAHKEQSFGGGGQDNQATDAGRIFEFSTEQTKDYKTKLGVKHVIFSIVLDLQYSSLKGKHWAVLADTVKDIANKEKYIISSHQLQLLMHSIYKDNHK